MNGISDVVSATANAESDSSSISSWKKNGESTRVGLTGLAVKTLKS